MKDKPKVIIDWSYVFRLWEDKCLTDKKKKNEML